MLLRLFATDGSGCGHAAVENVALDYSVTTNSSSNSVELGSYIAIFGTGFGPQNSPPPDGTSSSKPQQTETGLGVNLGANPPRSLFILPNDQVSLRVWSVSIKLTFKSPPGRGKAVRCQSWLVWALFRASIPCKLFLTCRPIPPISHPWLRKESPVPSKLLAIYRYIFVGLTLGQ